MIEVTREPEHDRYVVSIDDATVGRLDYALDGATMVALHTEVESAYAGRGLAAMLVERALADVHAAGQRIRPECPYVRRYLGKHREYDGLVDRAGADETGAV